MSYPNNAHQIEIHVSSWNRTITYSIAIMLLCCSSCSSETTRTSGDNSTGGAFSDSAGDTGGTSSQGMTSQDTGGQVAGDQGIAGQGGEGQDEVDSVGEASVGNPDSSIEGECGNGTIEQNEECDGMNLGGASCETLNNTGGTLSCSPTCLYDLSMCQNDDGSTGGYGATGGTGGGTTAGSGGQGGGATTTPGSWPAADPGKTGPYQTVTDNNVGPNNDYTMFRPAELTQRHPVITWGNGTGSSPNMYGSLLSLYASHGFIVIASNSPNVAQGDPPPMLNGVTWVLEQDTTEGSVLYQRVDRDNIGATGHSQGAMAASTAGTDSRIKTIAPIETLMAWRGGFHGPVLGLCGGQDTIVPCSSNRRSFDAISDQPVMYAELISADHGSWMCFGRNTVCPMYMITTAWFRVHLMNDMALRSMFYGECTICQDTATWVTDRTMMDQ